jgi:hypothetical protein
MTMHTSFQQTITSNAKCWLRCPCTLATGNCKLTKLRYWRNDQVLPTFRICTHAFLWRIRSGMHLTHCICLTKHVSAINTRSGSSHPVPMQKDNLLDYRVVTYFRWVANTRNRRARGAGLAGTCLLETVLPREFCVCYKHETDGEKRFQRQFCPDLLAHLSGNAESIS